LREIRLGKVNEGRGRRGRREANEVKRYYQRWMIGVRRDCIFQSKINGDRFTGSKYEVKNRTVSILKFI
jgi:hypothetical protein